nr:hypothetical protein [Lactobacillus rodentium]
MHFFNAFVCDVCASLHRSSRQIKNAAQFISFFVAVIT